MMHLGGSFVCKINTPPFCSRPRSWSRTYAKELRGYKFFLLSFFAGGTFVFVEGFVGKEGLCVECVCVTAPVFHHPFPIPCLYTPFVKTSGTRVR